MTITASYNLLPDYSRNYQPDRSVDSYPLSRTRNTVDLSVEADTHRSNQHPETYKFYVMTDATDTLYTREKQTEKLLARTKGSLVNLYA